MAGPWEAYQTPAASEVGPWTQYQNQVEGWGRLPAIAGSALAKGALEGAGAVGDLQGFIQRQANKLFDPLIESVGIAPPVIPRTASGQEMTYPGAGGLSLQQLFPGAKPEDLPAYLKANRDWLGPVPMAPPALGSENLVGAGRATGAVDNPALQPRNTGERYLAAGAEGVGGMLPYLPLAVGGAAANVARGLARPGLLSTAFRAAVQGAAGGVGGEAASELAPKEWEPYARAGGALTGAGVATGLLGLGGKIASAATGATTPVTQAYRNLGIEPTLAGDVTGSPLAQQIQTFAGKAPGGAGRIAAKSEKAIDEWGKALENTAYNLGDTRTLQQAGRAVQMEGNAWLTNFRNDSKAAWNNVDMHIPQSTPTPVSNYATTLTDIRNSMPNMPATARTLQPSLSRQLLDNLIQDIKSGTPTWKDVRGIRTRIGEMLAEPQLVGDTSYTELKRLYGALSSDIEGVVATRGQAAQQAFGDATAVTRSGHDFIENTLSNILRGNQISPEAAARAALGTAGGGGTFLQSIRNEMPKAADELAAYQLRDMALARAGQQTGAGTRLSPGTFLTDRFNRLSPEAESALFADPYIAQRVNDLSTVAGSMRGTERFLNTSNTATATMIGQALNAASPLAAYQGYTMGGGKGALAALAAALAPWTTGQLAARAVSTPALTRLMAARPPPVSPASGLLAGGALYPSLRELP